MSKLLKDLKSAQGLLSDDYKASDAKSISMERLRPNKSTATALLSRVFLYTNNWAGAEEESTKIIDRHDKYDYRIIGTCIQ